MATYLYCSACVKRKPCMRRRDGPLSNEIYHNGRLIKCSAGAEWQSAKELTDNHKPYKKGVVTYE